MPGRSLSNLFRLACGRAHCLCHLATLSPQSLLTPPTKWRRLCALPRSICNTYGGGVGEGAGEGWGDRRHSLTRIAAYALASSSCCCCPPCCCCLAVVVATPHSALLTPSPPFIYASALPQHCRCWLVAAAVATIPRPALPQPSAQSDFLPTDFVIFAEYGNNMRGLPQQ